MDNYQLWRMNEDRKEREAERFPKCTYCAEPIFDDYLFDINDEIICEDCLNTHFRKDASNYYE